MAGGETHQVVWDSLLDYGRLEWQSTLIDFFNLFLGGGHQMLLMRTFLNNLIMFGESTVVLLRKNVVVM